MRAAPSRLDTSAHYANNSARSCKMEAVVARAGTIAQGLPAMQRIMITSRLSRGSSPDEKLPRSIHSQAARRAAPIPAMAHPVPARCVTAGAAPALARAMRSTDSIRWVGNAATHAQACVRGDGTAGTPLRERPCVHRLLTRMVRRIRSRQPDRPTDDEASRHYPLGWQRCHTCPGMRTR